MTQDPGPLAASGRSASSAGAHVPKQAPARRRSDGVIAPILPECCNPAIAIRILAMTNALAVLAALVQALAGEPFWRALTTIGVILEPVALVSIGLLCGLRRTLLRRAGWVQWSWGIAVPATATALLSAIAVRWLPGGMTVDSPVGWMIGRVLIAAVIAALLLEYFRLRTLALSPSLAEARLQALQARIRPHFLFNSLNTVLALLRSQPLRAEQTLENLSDLFRVFMRDTRDMVAIGEEVEICRKYLEIEKLRLGERLSVTWDLRTMPADALVPSLLLQPLLENAVHHGIESSPLAGSVGISIRQTGERVVVEIVNTVDPSARTRTGNQMALSNIRERLLLLYDSEAVLKTAVLQDSFSLLLEFPCRKERRRQGVPRRVPSSLDPDR